MPPPVFSVTAPQRPPVVKPEGDGEDRRAVGTYFGRDNSLVRWDRSRNPARYLELDCVHLRESRENLMKFVSLGSRVCIIRGWGAYISTENSRR